MKLILIILLVGCTTTPERQVCYSAAEDARVKRWFKDAQEYEDNLAEDLRRSRKFKHSIEGLKGYCS